MEMQISRHFVEVQDIRSQAVPLPVFDLGRDIAIRCSRSGSDRASDSGTEPMRQQLGHSTKGVFVVAEFWPVLAHPYFYVGNVARSVSDFVVSVYRC